MLTDAGSIQNTFIWSISNISILEYIEFRSIDSPVFRIKSLSGSIWDFKMNLNFGRTMCSNDNKFAVVSLYLIGNDGESVHCKYSVDLIAVDGSVSHSNSGTSEVNDGYVGDRDLYIKIDSLQDKSLHFSGDILKFRCTVRDSSTDLYTNFQTLGESTLGFNRISFNHFVENLGLLSNPSQTFECPASSKYTIFVSKFRETISIDIRKHNESKEREYATLKIILLDLSGLQVYSRSRLVSFTNNRNLWELEPKIPISLIPEKQTQLLRKVSFNVLCEFAVTDKSYANEVEECEPQFSPDLFVLPSYNKLTEMQERFLGLYKEGKHSDVTLQVGKTSFHVHRFVLSARSRTFSEMLANSNSSSVFKIDKELQPFDVFLKYIYTGCLGTLGYESAIKLMTLAKEYEVTSLKDKCAHFLQNILSERPIIRIHGD